MLANTEKNERRNAIKCKNEKKKQHPQIKNRQGKQASGVKFSKIVRETSRRKGFKIDTVYHWKLVLQIRTNLDYESAWKIISTV
jgi:hypothetical protein